MRSQPLVMVKGRVELGPQGSLVAGLPLANPVWRSRLRHEPRAADAVNVWTPCESDPDGFAALGDCEECSIVFSKEEALQLAAKHPTGLPEAGKLPMPEVEPSQPRS